MKGEFSTIGIGSVKGVLNSRELRELLPLLAEAVRRLLLRTDGPGDAVNMIQSLVTTMIVNIPDVLWERMMRVKTDGKIPSIMPSLDEMRSFAIKGKVKAETKAEIHPNYFGEGGDIKQ